jgi:hypothetical protein
MQFDQVAIIMAPMGLMIVVLVLIARNPSMYLNLNGEFLKLLPTQMNQQGSLSERDVTRLSASVAILLVMLELLMIIGCLIS